MASGPKELALPPSSHPSLLFVSSYFWPMHFWLALLQVLLWVKIQGGGINVYSKGGFALN